jgi:adenylate kinase
VYRDQTSPLKEHYKNTGKLAPIKGIGTIEEIFSLISEAVEKVK